MNLVYNIVMKVYKFKFTKLTLVFIYLGLALAAAAFGVTLYNVISGSYKNSANIVYPLIGYAAMFFVSVLLFIILVSLLISSYYSINDKILKTSFGIIKSKFPIENIESIILDRKTNKLSVNFKDKSFIMIVVKPEWYEEFINDLLSRNSSIEYSINSKENSPDDPPKG